MIEEKTIIERIEEIKKRRSFLEDYREEAFEEFSEDHAHFTAALYDLQVCIQSCLDIAKHIVAAKSFDDPKEIKEIFLILAKMSIIKMDLAERLVQAGSVRNILVHGYLKVDPHLIHKHIRDDLPDFDEFVAAISRYLQNLKEMSQKS